MSSETSALERARAEYVPRLPPLLARGAAALALEEAEPTTAVADATAIAERFPHLYGGPILRFVAGGGPGRRPLRVGVVLSGGQAPGGHNVIAGLVDGIRDVHGDSRLFGFLGGPKGIFTERSVELSPDVVEPYRNTGGFDMIGSGRDKIETAEQLAACRAVADRLELDGLVVVGGDDSNTNAAVLAEYFSAAGARTVVIGVPKTIDGDLRGERVEMSFGFDTATKIYSELIGNICRDAKSAGKYWHFIKLMGRSASHVTLECALRTRPNVALIAEEVAREGWTLERVVDSVSAVVRRRAAAGRPYGVCLVPEGLIEFIPEVRTLIAELNTLVHDRGAELEALPDPAGRQALIAESLSTEPAAVFRALPASIREQLLLDRDSHGNVQVSKIETEKLLMTLVAERVEGDFPTQHHFFGYEGRSAAPSNFDADYTYTLGRLAALLTAFGRTGTICSVRGLADAPDRWETFGVPLTSMMQMETRKGRPTPVIAKALVDLDGAPFRAFVENRAIQELEDDYLYPGPIQYFGPDSITTTPPQTLVLERDGR